ncbi:DUF3325 family protein [Pseudoalteromonas nigrifaciens]
MLLLIWLTSLFGFSVLSLSMARHRKLLQLSPLTQKQEKYYLCLGLIALAASLVFAFIHLPNSEAVPIWFGLLSVVALKVAIYLSVKFHLKLPK